VGITVVAGLRTSGLRSTRCAAYVDRMREARVKRVLAHAHARTLYLDTPHTVLLCGPELAPTRPRY
jgi:hypothetical protein